jgi:hypothetical protein
MIRKHQEIRVVGVSSLNVVAGYHVQDSPENGDTCALSFSNLIQNRYTRTHDQIVGHFLRGFSQTFFHTIG